jgi:hypothetical protein
VQFIRGQKCCPRSSGLGCSASGHRESQTFAPTAAWPTICNQTSAQPSTLQSSRLLFASALRWPFDDNPRCRAARLAVERAAPSFVERERSLWLAMPVCLNPGDRLVLTVLFSYAQDDGTNIYVGTAALCQ